MRRCWWRRRPSASWFWRVIGAELSLAMGQIPNSWFDGTQTAAGCRTCCFKAWPTLCGWRSGGCCWRRCSAADRLCPVPAVVSSAVGTAYVELMRNTPPLVLMFIGYFFVASQIMPLLGSTPWCESPSPVLGLIEWVRRAATAEEFSFGAAGARAVRGRLCRGNPARRHHLR